MELEIRRLRKHYGAKEVLKGISFSVKGGRTMGFLGRNGAGKTTTLRILAGVFASDDGEVLLDGVPLNRKTVKVGYLPEERGLYSKIGILNQLTYIGQLKGMDRSGAADSAMHWLTEFELQDALHKNLGTLSKGNQQKVQIIQAIIDAPDILILDEPFSGLDPVNARALKKVIRTYEEQEKILIFSSHEMSYVEEFCTDITMIREGSILLSGSLCQIKRDRSHNRVYLRVRGLSVDELCRELVKEFGDAAEVLENTVVLQLSDSLTHERLLQAVIRHGWELESYGSYEPSLDSIFVETNRLTDLAGT